MVERDSDVLLGRPGDCELFFFGFLVPPRCLSKRRFAYDGAGESEGLPEGQNCPLLHWSIPCACACLP